MIVSIIFLIVMIIVLLTDEDGKTNRRLARYEKRKEKLKQAGKLIDLSEHRKTLPSEIAK